MQDPQPAEDATPAPQETPVEESVIEEGVETLGSAFARVPGLITKVAIANTDANLFGGVYFFTNAKDRDKYAEGMYSLMPLLCCPCMKMNVPNSIRRAADKKATFERFVVAKGFSDGDGGDGATTIAVGKVARGRRNTG